jgi:hypothetical protein
VWASLKLDAHCPLFDHSDSANANRSNADQDLHLEMYIRGNKLSITQQCASLDQEEGYINPILPNF